MVNEWSLREEILEATQSWPWLALFCVLGSIMGLVVSLVWPTPHRATRELYVGLSFYNSVESQMVSESAGVEIVNANDFKNWQMASLNTLILKDDVIDETLSRLQELDPYWQRIDRSELADSLDVYWRNAGKWRLVAENSDPERAAQAVTVWENVVVDHVHTAVLESQRAMVLDLQMRALAEKRAALISQTESLRQVLGGLNSELVRLEGQPTEGILDSASHWQLWLLASAADFGPGWSSMLDTYPTEPAELGAYKNWIGQAQGMLQGKISSLEQQAQDIERRDQEIITQFSVASQNSLGLSATLDVDKISETRLQQTVVRPMGMLMLAGSLLGIMIWLIYWLGLISLRGRA